MAKRWLQSVDVLIDDDSGALVVQGHGYRGLAAPDAVTATAGQWTAIDLPAGVQYLHVGLTEETYLVAQPEAGAPTGTGCGYRPDGNHVIECAGCTKLYAKPADVVDSIVTWTPFGAAS